MNCIKRSVLLRGAFRMPGGRGRGSFAPPDPLKGVFRVRISPARGEIKEEMIFLRKIRNGGTEN